MHVCMHTLLVVFNTVGCFLVGLVGVAAVVINARVVCQGRQFVTDNRLVDGFSYSLVVSLYVQRHHATSFYPYLMDAAGSGKECQTGDRYTSCNDCHREDNV